MTTTQLILIAAGGAGVLLLLAGRSALTSSGRVSPSGSTRVPLDERTPDGFLIYANGVSNLNDGQRAALSETLHEYAHRGAFAPGERVWISLMGDRDRVSYLAEYLQSAYMHTAVIDCYLTPETQRAVDLWLDKTTAEPGIYGLEYP